LVPFQWYLRQRIRWWKDYASKVEKWTAARTLDE